MRVILFGGCFDPIHKGHIAIAKRALEYVHAERVLFIPSSRSFFSKSQIQTTAQHRLTMLKIALTNLTWAQICSYEIEKDLHESTNLQHHYTVDTVNFLKENYIINKDPFLLIGDDLLPSLHKWKDIGQLLMNVQLIIATRVKEKKTPNNGTTFNNSHPIPDNTVFLDNLQSLISSSEIKNRIQNIVSYRDLVHQEVYNYIEKNCIYHSNC